MPPTAPIDSSLPPDEHNVFYVLEQSSIWSTQNLSAAGGATWTEAYTVASFESANSVTEAQFLRIVAPTTSLVYVLAAAKSESIFNPWILKSQNGGLTWAAYKVDDAALTTREYTVTHKVSASQTWGGFAITFTTTHERIGDDENTYNPWAIADRIVTPDTGSWYGITFDGTTLNQDGAGTVLGNNALWGRGNQLLGGIGEPGEVFLNDYFGVGNWNRHGMPMSMPIDAARVNIKNIFDHSSDSYTAYAETWAFWNKPEVISPKALDVARTNNAWVYVGLDQKIRASEDGGQTWFDFTTEAAGNGANDVHVDPQIAGAVYVWSDTGNLNLWLKETLGHAATLNQTAIMTETANKNFLRIARDINSGRLWAIPDGNTLVERYLGTNTNRETGLTTARGLHAYYGGFLIHCEAANIYISDNYGVTWTAKKGGWSEYASGINAHRMTS